MLVLALILRSNLCNRGMKNTQRTAHWRKRRSKKQRGKWMRREEIEEYQKEMEATIKRQKHFQLLLTGASSVSYPLMMKCWCWLSSLSAWCFPKPHKSTGNVVVTHIWLQITSVLFFFFFDSWFTVSMCISSIFGIYIFTSKYLSWLQIAT